MDPFLGEIRPFPFNFAPKGWAFCMGQLLPISQNTALFSLLGTTYGGNGVTTFALPDLRGRVPMSLGPSTVLGEMDGTEDVTLTAAQIPSHTHALETSSVGTSNSPVGNRPGKTSTAIPTYGTADGTFAPDAISLAGGNQRHTNLQPFLALGFCIALQGVYPARD